MKKLLGIIISTLVICNVFSADLKSVCDGLSKTPITKGDFTQIKTINAKGRQLKSSGVFIISELGIMWKTLKPFPSNLIVTENAMIQIAADGKKNVMSAADNQIFQNISKTLRSVFAGDSKELENSFNVDFENKDKGLWTVILTPKDSTIASIMKSLELSGSSINSQVTLLSLEMQETSNNKIRYDFTNQTYPKELSADEKNIFAAD
ncbi:MAG: outer membrane lipoprotein carrier protein LolA [Treponema sp.]|nr:outer membrane lipoprotein carrier protein LolA [Treponema sp.]